MININFDYSKVRGSTELHNKLKKEFTVMVSRMFPNVIIIPYDVGQFRAFSNPDAIVRCGQYGVPDLIVLGKNYYLFFDAKTGRNSFQKNQKAFAARVEAVNEDKRVFKLSTIKNGLEIIEKYENIRHTV